MPRILLVDDEAPLRDSLTYALTKEGYSVVTAADGAKALELAMTERPDIVILDLMLPRVRGPEVCRRIREHSDVPIVMLTAKDQPSDTLAGFEVGADDYVTKPFNTKELLARVRALVRRFESSKRLVAEDRELVARLEELARGTGDDAPSPPTPRAPSATPTFAAGALVVDNEHSTITLDGKPLPLSATEFELLRILVAHANRVVTRTELIEHIWGLPTSDRLVMLNMHIRCLREKIEKDPGHPRQLLTVPGIGFELLDH